MAEQHHRPIETMKRATRYCDYHHESIQALTRKLVGTSTDPGKIIGDLFHFVHEQIIFGGDVWQVRASETLKKGYGACYNKNLLLVAMLRASDIPADLCASPMKRTFGRPAMGNAHRTVSEPFYHCFTTVYLGDEKQNIDPTLDTRTYETFFRPGNPAWDVTWREGEDMLLYSDSIMGASVVYHHIDQALDRHLDSYFLFRHEPAWLLKPWLKLGSRNMWKRTGCYPGSGEKRNTNQRHAVKAI